MHKMQWQEYLQQCKASGDSLLREKQFEVAMNGDKTMLVWLGKQRLNQTEKQTIQHNLDNVELSKLSDSELEQLAARDK